MLGGRDLSNLEILFKRNCPHHNLLFGGVSVVLIGDPAQLPPIGQKCLYDSHQRTDDGKRGHDLYNLVADANTVILNINKRSADGAYISMQTDIRNGKFTDESIRVLNRLSFSSKFNKNEYTPIVTTSNANLKLLYEQKATLIANYMTRAGLELPILLLADLKSAVSRTQNNDTSQCPLDSRRNRKRKRPSNKKPAPLTSDELRYLDRLPDTCFDNIPVAFFLYLGAPAMISINLGVKYQLANGTMGEIIGWQFPNGTTFENSFYHGVPVRIPLLNGLPVHIEAIFFKVTSYKLVHIPPGQPLNLPPNTICIPRLNHTINKPIPLPQTDLQSSRSSVGVQIDQIPVRTAEILTHYNVQGSQYDQYLIWDLHAKSFYQTFSRGKRGLSSIKFRSKITREFADKVIARTSINDEIKRLQPLHDHTKSRLG